MKVSRTLKLPQTSLTLLANHTQVTHANSWSHSYPVKNWCDLILAVRFVSKDYSLLTIKCLGVTVLLSKVSMSHTN